MWQGGPVSARYQCFAPHFYTLMPSRKPMPQQLFPVLCQAIGSAAVSEEALFLCCSST